ncbi:MAG: LytTR family DNA-binding domain-containing protein [Novosphingobium sp.]
MMRALLIDDEPLALRRLTLTLDQFDDVEIVDSTTSARRAVVLIRDLRPDVVFLDIAMPGLSGFDVIDRLPPGQRPAVVFATAFGEHAVQAFGVDAVDYLLKPVAPDRLRQAVDRVHLWLAARNMTHAGEMGYDQPEGSAASSAGEDSLWAHRHQKFVRIPLDQIVWIEAEGDYVQIHAKEGGGLMRTTLSALHAKLDPVRFIRVHRSAICRTSEITGLQRKPTGALRLSLSNGDWVPVGRSYSGGLRALHKQMWPKSIFQSEPGPGE